MKIVAALVLFMWTAHVAYAQTAPAPDTQAFALGLCLQTPTAQTEAFLQSVGELRSADDDAVPDAVGKLAANARALRQSDLTAYTEASQLLVTMNAPPNITQWAQGTVSLLAAPVLPSASVDKKQDSADTQAVLSVMDEAQAVKLNVDANAPAVQAWLKLTRGGAGVWAYTLGRMSAGMSVAVQTGRPFLLPRASILTLHDTAPPGTSKDVVQTLALLSPRGKGNLSAFVPPLSPSVPASAVERPAQTFVQAYGANALTARLAVTP